ncbi:MAG TPA: ABC transporter ATP-binding protein [Allosphingosinicella sp.]|jgi:ABC-2 type transport system ATP-binding protein/lipopolysaccharide transport system ATP-binding protein
MANLSLRGVTVEFPLYQADARSMRRFALQGALGRRLRTEGRHPAVTALAGIDLDLAGGDRLAIVGPNGSGKSTLLRTMAGVYAPAAGTVVRTGSLTPLLSPGTGIDLAATGLENIFLIGMHQGIMPKEMRAFVDEIVEWTELGAFIGAPLRTYSAGMMLRLAFAVSTAVPPDILLMDEWVGVADADFQLKAYERMSRFVERTRILVLASHSEALLEIWCNRAVRLEEGRIAASGPLADVLEAQRAGR